LQRFAERLDADLLAFRADKAYFSCPNFVVDLMFLANNLPPPKFVRLHAPIGAKIKNAGPLGPAFH